MFVKCNGLASHSIVLLSLIKACSYAYATVRLTMLRLRGARGGREDKKGGGGPVVICNVSGEDGILTVSTLSTSTVRPIK